MPQAQSTRQPSELKVQSCGSRWFRTWAIGLTNVALFALVGCAPDAQDGAAVDPQTDADDLHAPSSLSAAERQLLARARGREWTPLAPGDIEAFMTGSADSTSVLAVWDPRSGAQGLRGIQDAIGGLDTLMVRAAIVVPTTPETSEVDDRVALRESQIYLPAYRLAADRAYSTLPGESPRPLHLYVSAAGSREVEARSLEAGPAETQAWLRKWIAK